MKAATYTKPNCRRFGRNLFVNLSECKQAFPMATQIANSPAVLSLNYLHILLENTLLAIFGRKKKWRKEQVYCYIFLLFSCFMTVPSVRVQTVTNRHVAHGQSFNLELYFVEIHVHFIRGGKWGNCVYMWQNHINTKNLACSWNVPVVMNWYQNLHWKLEFVRKSHWSRWDTKIIKITSYLKVSPLML